MEELKRKKMATKSEGRKSLEGHEYGRIILKWVLNSVCVFLFQ
jgi:hypothetical protein